MIEETTLSKMRARLEALPVDDEPLTEEDREAIAAARADTAPGLSDAELCRSLGLPE